MDPWTLRRPIADFPEKGENGVLSPKEYLKLKGRPIPGEMPEHGDDEVLCTVSVHPVARSIADEFASKFGFSSGDFSSMEPIFEGIELSVGDKEVIAGRIRQEICNVLAATCGEHVVCTDEITDGELVCLNDLDYQPVTNTEPSKQGGFTRMNIQDPDMPQLEFPEGIDVLRTIYRIDPDKWIPIETQTVCGKTPTPPGWVDLWNYRKALQSLKRDENGVIVEPIEAKFEPDAWQETHTPVG